MIIRHCQLTLRNEYKASLTIFNKNQKVNKIRNSQKMKPLLTLFPLSCPQGAVPNPVLLVWSSLTATSALCGVGLRLWLSPSSRRAALPSLLLAFPFLPAPSVMWYWPVLQCHRAGVSQAVHPPKPQLKNKTQRGLSVMGRVSFNPFRRTIIFSLYDHSHSKPFSSILSPQQNQDLPKTRRLLGSIFFLMQTCWAQQFTPCPERRQRGPGPLMAPWKGLSFSPNPRRFIFLWYMFQKTQKQHGWGVSGNQPHGFKSQENLTNNCFSPGNVWWASGSVTAKA